MLKNSNQATVMNDPTTLGTLRSDIEDIRILPWKFQWLNAFYDKASHFLYFWTGSLFVTSTIQLTGQPVCQLFKHGAVDAAQPNMHNWKTAGHGLVLLKELSITGSPKKLSLKAQELHNFPES